MSKAATVAMLTFVVSSMLAMGAGLTVSQISEPLQPESTNWLRNGRKRTKSRSQRGFCVEMICTKGPGAHSPSASVRRNSIGMREPVRNYGPTKHGCDKVRETCLSGWSLRNVSWSSRAEMIGRPALQMQRPIAGDFVGTATPSIYKIMKIHDLIHLLADTASATN